MLNGKKPKRVMLNITEEMWRQLYAYSDLNGLPLEHVIRYLLAWALSQKVVGMGNAPILQVQQQKATGHLFPEVPEPQKAAEGSEKQQRARRA